MYVVNCLLEQLYLAEYHKFSWNYNVVQSTTGFTYSFPQGPLCAFYGGLIKRHPKLGSVLHTLQNFNNGLGKSDNLLQIGLRSGVCDEPSQMAFFTLMLG